MTKIEQSDWSRDWSCDTTEGVNTPKTHSSRGAAPGEIELEGVRCDFMDTL